MKKLSLDMHPDAYLDVLEAHDWYAGRSEQAAVAFRKELQIAGRAIQRHPERWANYLFGTRRYLMKRFPFVIVYRVTADRIEIVAVAHGRRRPGYWRKRLNSE